MNLKSPISWIATALMLSVAAPAVASDAADEAPRMERKRVQPAKRGKRIRRPQPRKRDAAKFRKKVLRRLGKLGKRVDKVAAKKKLSPEAVAKMRRTLTVGSAGVKAALATAVADGTLSHAEVRNVRTQMKALRQALREARGKKANQRRKHRKAKRANKRGKAQQKSRLKRRTVSGRAALRNPFAER